MRLFISFNKARTARCFLSWIMVFYLHAMVSFGKCPICNSIRFISSIWVSKKDHFLHLPPQCSLSSQSDKKRFSPCRHIWVWSAKVRIWNSMNVQHTQFFILRGPLPKKLRKQNHLKSVWSADINHSITGLEAYLHTFSRNCSLDIISWERLFKRRNAAVVVEGSPI